MAEAIGSVRATFTASASGMTGAIDQIVGKLGGFAAQTKRTQAASAEYNSILAKLTNDFAKGNIGVEQFAERIGRVQGKFKGIGEAEREGAALKALAAGGMMAGASAEDLAAAQARLSASVRAATPPIERLSIDLAKNRADFLAGVIGVEQYRNVIATLPGQINGTETAAAKMERVFKQAQETVRGLVTPAQALEQQLRELDEQFEAGAIDDQQYAAATATVKQKLKELTPEFAAARAAEEATNAAMEEGRRITAQMATPMEKYEQELARLKGLLDKGAISEETFNRATKQAKAELDKTAPAAKSLGSAFGGLPGPIGAAARALDVMSKSLASTAGGFKGGIGAGISNFVGQLKSGIANAGSTGGASLVGIAPQIGLIAGAGFAAVRGLQALTGALASVGSEVERTEQLASRLGVSFQEYEILKVAAQQAGVEVEALAGAQTKGLKAISAARGGAEEQAQAFAALGVTQEQLNSTNPSQLLEQVAAKLNAIEDPATRAALTMKIFGKSGNDVLPALAGIDSLREGIQRLGDVMNDTDKMRFKGLDDAFDNVSRAFSRLGEVLLTPFTEAFANIAEGVAAIAGGFASQFQPIASMLADFLGASTVGFRVLAETMGLISRATGAIYTIIGNTVASTIEWVSQSSLLAPLFQGLGSAANFVMDAFKNIGGWVSYVVEQLEYWAGIEVKPPQSGVDAEAMEAQIKAQEDAKKAAEDAQKAAEKRAETIKEGLLTPLEKMQIALAEINDLEQRGLLTAEQRAAAEAKIREEFAAQDPLAQQARAAAEEQKKVAEDLASQMEKAATAGLDLGAAAVPVREQFTQALEQIRQDLKAGFIDADEAKAQAAAAADAMNEEFKKIGEQKKAVEDIDAAIKNSAKAGKELGDAADGIRASFVAAAEEIKAKVEQGLISPEDAKAQMAEATDAMNEELKRLGEDINFAEKIRDEMKTAGEKTREEIEKINANQTLTGEEKAAATANVLKKAKESLPGGPDTNDPVNKFREAQAKLQDAFKNGVITQKELAERQASVREELNSAITDLKDKQEQNAQPDRRAASAVSVNSSEGASTFFRLLRGQDDPTKKQLVEMQRQTRLLERVEQELQNNPAPVKI